MSLHIRTSAGGVLWAERAAIAVAVAAYLVIFQANLPNGDGMVYIGQIGKDALVWNPNHLYMEPLGLWLYRTVQAVGLHWSIFSTLKVLSGSAALLTALLFHAALAAVGLPAAARLLGTFGLVVSSHFISMAIAEEYFMIQMPLLAATLLLAVRWVNDPDGPRSRARLAGMGICATCAGLISINNGLAVAALGAAVAWHKRAGRRTAIASALWLWLAGAAVALPGFLLPYLASHTESSFAQWLTSYGGESGGAGALYGLEWTLRGVILSLATLVYGSISSLFLLGDLGNIGESLIRSRPLEFRPNALQVGFTLGLVLTAGALFTPFLFWLVRSGRHVSIAGVAACWATAYLLFNFLWVDTSNQFWFQVLLPFWLMLALFVTDRARSSRWSVIAASAVVVLMAVVNTSSVVLPRSRADLAGRRDALQLLLRDGDMLITTGWDDIVWMAPPEGASHSQRILLMNLAIQTSRGEPGLEALPAQIQTHLAGGGRVVVARVFDLDSEARPWEQLAKLQWPRARIVKLLQPFAHRPIGEIGGVTFRELR